MPVLRFPSDQSLGRLHARPDIGFARHEPDYDELFDDRSWFDLGEARGVVESPDGVEFQLHVREFAPGGLSELAAFPPGTLRSLTVHGASIHDDDLSYLRGLDGLAFLDLFGLSITDDALRHLGQVPNLR